MTTIGKISALVLASALIGIGGSALAEGSMKLFFEGDMVRGRAKEGATGPTCVLTSQFKHKEEVVWRVRVLDQNGNGVDDKGLTSLVVMLPDGSSHPMAFGGHPHAQPVDNFWTVSWLIPDEYPTGTLSYKVVATMTDGTTQTWSPFNVSLSQLAVIPGEVTFTK